MLSSFFSGDFTNQFAVSTSFIKCFNIANCLMHNFRVGFLSQLTGQRPAAAVVPRLIMSTVGPRLVAPTAPLRQQRRGQLLGCGGVLVVA
jgi:hypothetical protein